MTRPLRILARILLGLLVLIVLVAAVVYLQSQRRLQHKYAVAAEPALVIPTDSASIARGGHLFLATAACAHCHGVKADGGRDATPNPVLIMSPPNLTRGNGGIGGSLQPADWERAIRHGLRRDSTSLIVMPSDVYQHMSDADLASLIAYLQQLPPVDRAPIPTGVGPIGRALLAAGKLPVQIAPRVQPHGSGDNASADLVEQGRYIANISGCHGCHNAELTGGPVPGEPPDRPKARNITPAGIGQWSEEDFVRAIREGKRPDGVALNTFMPWERYSGMSTEETHALWANIRSVPAKPTPS